MSHKYLDHVSWVRTHRWLFAKLILQRYMTIPRVHWFSTKSTRSMQSQRSEKSMQRTAQPQRPPKTGTSTRSYTQINASTTEEVSLSTRTCDHASFWCQKNKKIILRVVVHCCHLNSGQVCVFIITRLIFFSGVGRFRGEVSSREKLIR